MDLFKDFFLDYFRNNQDEFVCTVSAIIRDDVMTIAIKGQKTKHFKINELLDFKGSDNDWCVYDSSKFKRENFTDLSRIECSNTYLSQKPNF